jgi:hypothetical protein
VAQVSVLTIVHYFFVSVNNCSIFFFLLLVVIPYAVYGVLLGYGVMLLVTSPQATTKIMAGMVGNSSASRNKNNGGNGTVDAKKMNSAMAYLIAGFSGTDFAI